MGAEAARTDHRRARRLRLGGAITSFLLFIALTWGMVFTIPGQNLDNLSMESLVARVSLIPGELSVLPSLVSGPGVATVSAAVALVAVLRRRPALALRALLLVGAANLTTQILKAVLARPALGVSLLLDNSYPSGHTTFAASIAVSLVLVAPRGFRSAAAVFGWAWTSTMGVLVIALGWHRLADVVGAILVVAVWSFLISPIEERIRYFPAVVRAGNWLSWFLLVGGAGSFALLSALVRNKIDVPLSWAELNSLAAAGTGLGRAFAAATILTVAGVAAVTISSVDRFSSVGQAN